MILLLELKMNELQQQQSGAAVLYNAAGQPVAITLPPQLSPSSYQSYKSRQSMLAGAILLTAGFFSIIFNAVGISLSEVMSYSGIGIWCGILVSKVMW